MDFSDFEGGYDFLDCDYDGACIAIVGSDKHWAIGATNASCYDNGRNEEDSNISNNNHYWCALSETCGLGNAQSMHWNPK